MTGGTIYAERSITISRHFKAPRELVFKAWTDLKHIQEWFGPEGFTNPVVTGEVKPGGTVHVTMHGPKGTDFDRDFPCTLVFREIVPGKRLVFENDAIAPDGSTLIEGRTTVSFSDEDGGTRMVMETRGRALKEEAKGHLQGMEQGWSGSFEKLRRLLEK
jgi:uncharacterized protein YndB with AHSA1/START domain